MRLFLTCLFLLVFSSATAAPIPSTASGVYATPSGDCSIVFSRFGADHVNVDIACPGQLSILTDNRVRCTGVCSHSTAFAFGGACIGAPEVSYAFPVDGSYPGLQWLAFDSFDGQRLMVRRGVTANQLYNGGGVFELWDMRVPIASPFPYSCKTANPRLRILGR